MPPCSESCRQKCTTKFDEEQRNVINRCYWALNFKDRKLWLQSMILEKEIGRKKVEGSWRKTTLLYYLPSVSGYKEAVCKMFLRTLGMKTDGQITTFLKARCETVEGKVIPLYDKRGKHPAAHKADTERIKEHINSYNPVVGHYARERAPNRRYLNPDLSIQKLWKDKSKSEV